MGNPPALVLETPEKGVGSQKKKSICFLILDKHERREEKW